MLVVTIDESNAATFSQQYIDVQMENLDSVSNISIMREKFNECFDKLKEEVKSSFGDQNINEDKIFLAIGSNTPKLKSFLKKQGVLEYLSRPYDPKSFDRDGPTDCSPQELELYECLPHKANVYRGDISKKRFFSSISDCDRGFFGILEKGINSINPKSALLITPAPLSLIRNLVDSVHLRLPPLRNHYLFDPFYEPIIKNGIRFLITPCLENDHAIAVVHILNQDTKAPQISIFINSTHEASAQGHLEKIKPEFTSIPTDEINRNLKFYFSDADQLSDDTRRGLNSREGFKGLVLEELKISPTNVYSFKLRRTTPLISISLGLQAEEDNNCLLFSFNVSEAIAKMSLNHSIVGKIFELSDEIEDKNYDAFEKISELKDIFMGSLKKSLSKYYDCSSPAYPAYPKDIIDKEHMMERWKLSGDLLKKFSETP